MSQDQQLTVEKLFQGAHKAMSQRRPIEARQYLEQALKKDNKQARLWHLLADTYLATHGLGETASLLESALINNNFEPTDRISLQIHLATTYVKADDLGAAVKSIDLDAVLKLKNPTLAARAGYLLAICEEHSAALAALETARASQPDNAELLFNTAAAHRSMGNLETAETMYDQVLQLAPNSYPAYWLRSSLRTQTEENNHVTELKKLASRSSLSIEGQILANFSLAKELEDLGQYEESFSALAKGAALKKSTLGYTVEPDLRAIETFRDTYNAEAITRNTKKENSNGEGVIFILGMPRTGSTLVDRILSSQKEVDSSGEPDTFAQIFYRAAMRRAHIQDLTSATQLTAIQKSIYLDFEEIGQTYQKKLALRAKQKNSLYIIDKNPSNFLHLGAIRLSLPKAKIIHIRRNPMDTCYAIFKTLFNNGHPYSYDLNDLATYYSAYDQLMNHWKSIFGSEYFELSYEDLITTPVEASKELMQYCGLDWSENCLDFHNNRAKGTATASAAQVRRPIYSDSLEMWKNYEQELAPLWILLKENGII